MKRRNSDFPVRFFLLVGLTFLLAVVASAQPVSFTANVSSHRVSQNEVFDVQFELSNSQGGDFVPPSFADFRVVGGPSMGSSTTIINGAMSSSQSWSYSLMPTKLGTFTIGSATVMAGRKRMTSNPVTIEVVKGRDIVAPGGTSGDQSVLLVAEVEPKSYYPGQQIILNYRILFTQNIQSLNLISEDDYADFFVQPFTEFSKDPAMVRIKGTEYTSRIIKSVALFPHQSGIYTLQPMVMSVGLNSPWPGMRGFFNMQRMQDIRVASDPIKITILPLPSNAPSTFHGAVGKYVIKTDPAPNHLTTDDALTISLEITGDGDGKRWDPPTPVADTSFQIYDPKILVDNQVEKVGIMENQRTLEYQMIPQSEGQFKVYIPFTYFDPDAKRYVTIASDTIFLRVSRGIGKTHGLASEDESAINAFDIMPVYRPFWSDHFWTSWPHLLLFGLLVTGSCWGLVLNSRQRKAGLISEKEKIRSAAGQVAIQKLDELAARPALADRDFFEAATALYNKFLCDRLLIPPADLDETRLPGYMQKSNIEDSWSARALSLFQRCLPVRYGGAPAGYTREEMMTEMKAIIAAI
ncbi:MAG TPA: BatD family protein [Saprospiraceae bacterium]|nr:BatD family protein [Saprospiraceae bacterium]